MLVHHRGAMTGNSFNYSYDKVGNRKNKSNRDGAHHYTYDTLNGLVEALNPLPSNSQESYAEWPRAATGAKKCDSSKGLRA